MPLDTLSKAGPPAYESMIIIEVNIYNNWELKIL